MPLNAEPDAGRIPVLVVTGFLGSGKTTLVRKALEDERFARSLLLVNEAAQMGIDDRVVGATPGQAVRLLGNGCLCCAVQDDLRQSLLDIAEDESLTRSIRRIIIETSGLADPVSTIATLTSHPRLTRRLRLQAVVALVDAQQALDQSREFVEFGAQVESADLLMLAKAAFASPDRTARVHRLLGRINPMAEICDANAPDAAQVLAAANTRLVTARLTHGWLPGPDAPVNEGDHYARLTPVAGGRARHTRNVVAFAIHADLPLDWILFSTWFSAMLHAHGRQLLRVKGILALRDSPEPVLVNSVRHVVHFPEHLTVWADAKRSTCLVFIARDLAPRDVLRSMQIFVAGETTNYVLTEPGETSRNTAGIAVAGEDDRSEPMPDPAREHTTKRTGADAKEKAAQREPGIGNSIR